MSAAVSVACGDGHVTQSSDGPDPSDDPSVVTTDSGPVRGSVGETTRTFAAIPYAKAPVAALRWEAPQRPDPWREPRDAAKAGSPCSQPTDQPIALAGGVEDCLSLNVTTPKGATKPLPVIVWIHGGSFVYGDGASYRANRLAVDGQVIVVTINYRLGVFGFFPHPALKDSANLGLLDQQAALQWVQRNITHFGGDPANVTIMGQSGGGYSVCSHLAAPSSAGLFQRAIVQSAGCVGSADGAMSLERARAQAEAVAAAVGCRAPEEAECLRSKSTAELLEAAEGAGHEGFRPVIDGSVLPTSPGDAITTGNFNKVPVLHGSNNAEEAGRVGGMEMMTGAPLTADGYLEQIHESFGENATKVLAEYPVSDYGSPSEALSAVLTDSNWSTPALKTQRALATHVPVFAYELAEAEAPYFEGIPRPSFPIRTSHMLDLPYFFDNDLFEPLSPDQEKLAIIMIRYWGEFARRGDPNHDATPWTKFDSQGAHVQSLNSRVNGIGRTDFGAAHHCAFWESLSR